VSHPWLAPWSFLSPRRWSSSGGKRDRAAAALRRAAATIEPLEVRQLLAAQLTVTDSFAIFNDRLITLPTTIVGRTSAPQTFTLSNSGDAPLNISNFTSTNQADFNTTIQDNQGTQINGNTFAIAPGEVARVFVRFDPDVGGARTTNLTFTSDDPAEAAVVLTATGVSIAIPIEPSDLSAVGVSPNQIDLTWTDNSVNEDGFNVYRSDSSTGPFRLKARVAAGETSYSYTNLAPGTQLFFRVTAFNTAGESIPDTDNTATSLDAGSTLPTALDLGKLTGTAHIADSVGDGDGIDVFRFSMARDGRIIGFLTNNSDDIDIYLVSSVGSIRIIDQSIGEEDSDELVRKDVPAGDYFIKVIRGSTNVNSDYALDLSADYARNTRSSARTTALNGIVGNRAFNESVGKDDPDDYYVFDLTGRHRLDITVSNLEGDTDVYLLDSTGTVLTQSDGAGTAQERINRVVGQGRYYVRVVPGEENSPMLNYRIVLDANYPLTAPSTLT